MMITSKSGHNA
jgi:hypothetical protein